MSELSGAEALVRMLERHGVRHIFGLCGDTSLPLYDALYRLDHALEAALEAGGPTLVDVVTRPLHEARAPVSEWVA